MEVIRLCWSSVFLLFLLLQDGHAEDKPRKISMRIVEEPSNYGYAGNQANSGVRTLTPRVKASNVSGPAPLQQLAGRCYSKVLGNYKYKFCPFHNVTQYEQSLRWNPYSGILGVWQEWEIENNTFTSMVMPEGDDCGSKRRQVKVYFRCGNKNQVMNVTEPTTCNYMLEFKSPLVCHPHVMLVYPTLSDDLQSQWDQLEQELYEEQITQKGYKKRLRRILEAAGYQLSQKKQEELKAAVSSQDKTKDGDFASLQQCNAEYKKLLEEVETLREQIKTQEEKFPDEVVLDDHALDYDLMDDYL